MDMSVEFYFHAFSWKKAIKITENGLGGEELSPGSPMLLSSHAHETHETKLRQHPKRISLSAFFRLSGCPIF